MQTESSVEKPFEKEPLALRALVEWFLEKVKWPFVRFPWLMWSLVAVTVVAVVVEWADYQPLLTVAYRYLGGVVVVAALLYLLWRILRHPSLKKAGWTTAVFVVAAV